MAVLALSVASTASAGKLKFRGCATVARSLGPHGSDACTVVRGGGLVDLRALALSPDHRSLYSGTTMDCHTLAIDYETCNLYASIGHFQLKRNNGALRYRDCIGADSRCRRVPGGGLGAVESFAVSSDGAFVYTASYGICGVVDSEGSPGRCYGSNVLTTFERDSRTGELTYDGCITGDERLGPNGTGGCTLIPSATAQGYHSGFDNLGAVVLSPDASSLYVAASGDDAMAAFHRNPGTGALAYRGCITGDTASGPSGSGACTAIPSATDGGEDSGLEFVSALAVSPDGNSLYATSESDWSVAHFDTRPQSGALTYDGCDTAKPSVNDSGACVLFASEDARSSLRGAHSLAVSPDRKSVYVAGNGVAQLDRFPASGGLEFVRSYPNAGGPIALTASGKFLYTSINAGVVRFRRHALTGRLTRSDCLTGSKAYAFSHRCRKARTATRSGEGSGLDYPVALAATKRRVYVAARDDEAIARLAVKRRR